LELNVVIEISPSQVDRIVPLFQGEQLAMVLASIREGNTGARIWVDGEDSPRSAMLWDKGNNVFYLAGEREDGFVDGLRAIVHTGIRQDALAEHAAYFKAHSTSEAWGETIRAIFGELIVGTTAKAFYAYLAPAVGMWRDGFPGGLTLRPIDRVLLEHETPENVRYIVDEVRWMWPSIERFYERGFGFCALDGDRAVGWCTAEYVSARRCGTGIEIIRPYQRRGIGTALATAFVAHCIQHHVVPHWECATENVGSVKIAQRVGFTEIVRDAPFVGRFA
jgi:RimJ/RimL family protein N-acetyltransferase